MIVNFKSTVLEKLWVEGDVTLLPTTYIYEVIEILTILDASEKITDVELLGGFKIDEYKTNNWAVTVTVNNVEPIGSVTCLYSDGSAYDVDLNEYD
mgnify:CR=1 FL=1